MSSIPSASTGRLLPCSHVGEGGEMKIRVKILVDHYDFRAGTVEELIPAVVNYLLGKNIACVL